MATFDIGNKIQIVNPSANVDAKYGPWNSIAEAKTGVIQALREKGLTVGVIENGAVVEYWWKSGITDNDLVLKTAGGGGSGTPGVSVTNATINGSGHLIITLSDNTTIDAGVVVGPQGATGSTGATGNGIASTSYNASTGVLTITYTSGGTYSTGDLRGAAGSNGATWLSGSSAPTTQGVNGDFHLNTTTYDVSLKTAGTWNVVVNIKGPIGNTGNTGATGATGKGISSITKTNTVGQIDTYTITYTDSTTTTFDVVNGANYTHPTGDGNQHVPATSTTSNGKVLTAGATAGSAAWEAPAIGDAHGFVAPPNSGAFSYTNTGSSITFNLLAAAGNYKINGALYTNTGLTKAFIAALGQNFIYLTAAGLQHATTQWTITDLTAIPVATLNWDGTNVRVSDELHLASRNLIQHQKEHDTDGARYVSGFATTFASGATNTFIAAAGVIRDEERYHNISAKTQAQIAYRNAAGTAMIFDAPGTAFVKVGGTGGARPLYDNGSGTPVELGSSQYGIMWMYATNGKLPANSEIVFVMGQGTYASVAAAQAANQPTLSGMSVAEWKLLYRVIIRQSPTNALVHTQADDFRLSSSGPAQNAGAAAIVSANAVTVTPSGNLASTNVQAALEELQSDLDLLNNISATKGLLIGDSTIAAYSGQLGVEEYLLLPSDTYIGTTIINQAVPGHTILQQQNIWTADANKATYDWIIVQIGLNDLDPAESASVALSRLQTLINTINTGKKPTAIVILSAMNPCKQRLINYYGQTNGTTSWNKFLAMNDAIMGIGANKITGVSIRNNNHFALLSDGTGNLAATYDTGDGIHENNLGRKIISNCYRNILNANGRLTNEVAPENAGSVYTHPTGDGNLHVPATGTTNAGKVLTAGATAGAMTWEEPTSPQIDQSMSVLEAQAGASEYTLQRNKQTIIKGTLPNGVNNTITLQSSIEDEINEFVLHFKTNSTAIPTLIYNSFTPIWLNGISPVMKINKNYTVVFESMHNGTSWIIKGSWGEY